MMNIVVASCRFYGSSSTVEVTILKNAVFIVLGQSGNLRK